MFKRSIRVACGALVAAGSVGVLALVAGPATAATTVHTTPRDLCIPATWYKVTNVITRDGIVQLLPTVVEPNNSSTPSTLSMTVTVTGSVTAGLTGSIPVAPPGIAASIGPSVSAEVSGSVAVGATTTIPAGQTGYVQFGIITEKTNGIAYQRDVFCHVTSQPEVATAPEGFGYIASSASTHGGPRSVHSATVVTHKS